MESITALAETPLNTEQAVNQLSAIAHSGRLQLLRLLIQAGPAGLPAGRLAGLAGVPNPTASAQLLVLANARLVDSERRGRQVIYRADYQSMTALLAFLTQDCCGGEAAICQPIVQALGS